MVEHDKNIILSNVFKALSNTTRRLLLLQICQNGPCRVTDLADFYEMSLNAVSKHIKMLEKTGLVNRRVVGRIHWIEANLSQVQQAENWFDHLKSIWELRLDKLDEILNSEDSKMNRLKVNIEKTINAPVEKVFDAWLNPETMAKFMYPLSDMPASDVEINPTLGGSFTIIMHPEGQDLPHKGEYLEIDRPHRLKFTWESDHLITGSTVTLDFKPVNENQTLILLTHVKFRDEETRNDHEGGWTNILDMLNTVGL